MRCCSLPEQFADLGEAIDPVLEKFHRSLARETAMEATDRVDRQEETRDQIRCKTRPVQTSVLSGTAALAREAPLP